MIIQFKTNQKSHIKRVTLTCLQLFKCTIMLIMRGLITAETSNLHFSCRAVSKYLRVTAVCKPLQTVRLRASRIFSIGLRFFEQAYRCIFSIKSSKLAALWGRELSSPKRKKDQLLQRKFHSGV